MHHAEYSKLCNNEPGIPLFMQPYWLDAVAGPGNWQPLLATDDDGGAGAAWVVHTKNLRGGRAIVAPPLTPYTGIWIRENPSLSGQKLTEYRHMLIDRLEQQLPDHAIFEQKFHPDLSDWLPFYWKGYRQQTRYTFSIENGQYAQCEAARSDSFRRNVRTAARQFTVDRSEDVDLLFALVSKVFALRKEQIPFDLRLLKRVFQALREREQCTMYVAKNVDGTSGAIFVVWDHQTTYYLLGGRAGSNTKNSSNLLLVHAIEDARERGHHFDFEGSMIRGVNRFFRTFGANMIPYHYVYRYRGLARLKYLKKSL